MKRTTLYFALWLTFFSLALKPDSQATKWIVNVQNCSFTPSTISNIHIGDTIRWVWIGGSHTTTSSTIPVGAPEWDHQINSGNQSFEYITVVAGTHNYVCTPHASIMFGSFTVIAPPDLSFNLKVFLEGPFTGTEMSTGLNVGGNIPLSQPYNTAPWNYPGTENVPAIPNAEIVDWLLIELRDATGGAVNATPDKTVHHQAAFLRKDGSVVGLDGSSPVVYTGYPSNTFYIILRHRNHIGIMSSVAILPAGLVYSYDFTVSSAQVHGGSLGYKSLPGGIWGMAAGDSQQDGQVDGSDYTIWRASAGNQGYLSPDYTLESQVDNADKNDKLITNLSLVEQIPD